MAEIFGAVASGAGLVSLSMQLLESTQKLKGFYDSCHDAPEAVRQLYFDLETMSMALRQFEQYRQNDIFGSELLNRCITACDQAVIKIKAAVDKVDRLLSRARFAGRMYMGFKEPEVRKLLEEMEHAKSSMLLAYTSYCQSWNMRQHMKQATTAALHSERLSRLQDTLESGTSQLLGHVTALEHKNMEPSLLKSDLGQQQTKPKRLPHRELRRKQVYKFRLSLPRWFSESVWDFGLYASEGTWAIYLQHMNLRPWNAYIFEVVKSGDVEAVRCLLQSGRLSFQDCAGGMGFSNTLLEIAASEGHVDLCRFLLDNTSLFNDNSILCSAFHMFLFGCSLSQSRSSSMQSQDLSPTIEALHHLFVRDHGMDRSSRHGDDINEVSAHNLSDFLETESRWLTEDCLSLTKTTLQDILAVQSTSFTSLSFPERFQIAIRSRGWPAESFMELLTSEEPENAITTSAGWGGKQALHWAAAHFGQWARSTVPKNVAETFAQTTSYAELASRLIADGANVHALVRDLQFDCPTADPFLCFLHGTRDSPEWSFSLEHIQSRWNQHGLSMAVRRWGEMLVNAGQSLLQYAEAENQFLRTSEFSVDYSPGHRRLRPKRLAVIEGSGLALYATAFFTITKWSQERTHVPGSWSDPYNPAPNTIIWKPEIEDQCEGFRWMEKIETFTVESKPFLVEPITSDTLTTALLEASAELITGTQDDHGPVSRMVIQESNPRLRRRARRGRRAASMPPSLTIWGDSAQMRPRDISPDPMQKTSVAFGNESFYGVANHSRAHKCPFDGRWRICGDGLDKVSWRRCMRGYNNHNTSPGYANFGHGFEYMIWEKKLFSSEDHVDVAERYSRRFHPEMMGRVKGSRRRAKERDELKIAFPAMSFPPSEYSLAYL